MKREGHLFEKVFDKNNIRLAIIRSSKGKKKRREVEKVLDNTEYYVSLIYKILKNKSYIPSKYRVVTIYDCLNKKEREISKTRYFPDQIIQYCLMNIIEPILLRKMYLYSCGSIPGRGTSFGQKTLRKWLDNDVHGTKYCLKMDVRKFYPSVNKTILKKKFGKIIKDKDCLWLINSIIDSDCKGLPLGNYTSGYFSNFFLNDLDNYIKGTLKVKYYIRYVDDLIILSGNKKFLQKVLRNIEAFLISEDLVLKNNYQIFNVNIRDIDFLGFRFFRNKTILRKRNMFRISRKVRRLSKKDNISFKDACSVISYYGWIKHSDSYNFYHTRIKPYARISELKQLISNYSKEG
jgi:RNA-directed DNA polymerase